jgi:hypothetical protein
MSTPQDAPTRKKQKARAARKLKVWKEKQEQTGGTKATTTAKKK